MKRYILLLPPGGAPEGCFEAAAGLAKADGAELKAIYVVDSIWSRYSAADWLSTGPSRSDFDRYMQDTLRREGEGLIDGFSRAAAEAGLSVTAEISEGDPAEALIKAARSWHADAVVVPSGQKKLKAVLEKTGLVVHSV